MARRRILSPDEKKLWQHVTRHVVPLNSVGVAALTDGSRVPTVQDAQQADATTKPSVVADKKMLAKVEAIAQFSGKLRQLAHSGVGATRGLHTSMAPLNVSTADRTQPNPPGIDARQARKFRRGELPIDGRLDLHGMTEAVAHRSLSAFLVEARRKGWRCVLIITGKGDRSGKVGVLRKRIQSWFSTESMRQHILLSCSAQPRHGGEGAQYVLLRRPRRS